MRLPSYPKCINPRIQSRRQYLEASHVLTTATTTENRFKHEKAACELECDPRNLIQGNEMIHALNCEHLRRAQKIICYKCMYPFIPMDHPRLKPKLLTTYEWGEGFFTIKVRMLQESELRCRDHSDWNGKGVMQTILKTLFKGRHTKPYDEHVSSRWAGNVNWFSSRGRNAYIYRNLYILSLTA